MRPLPAAAAAAILLLSGAAPAQQATPGSIFTNGARTYYEAIDFSTPETAARAFLAAWARHDYATANAILSPEAQAGWVGQITRTFNLRTLLPRQADAVMQKSVYGPGDSLWDELMTDPNLLFDNLMQTAERFDALPFTIGTAAKAGTSAVAGDAATLPVKTEGRPAAIKLKLVRLPSGRWKVDQIVLPDADQTLKPWGFKAPQ
ncbi:hypothetical protein [Inquilinus limosus]|uniref:DUF3828 domain-containing protein n=1 Tax=Inquilinus limosus TaxID=171674 RepID=A0A211ZPV9_9PROT|nr:hypothetical protein [Inquilinus limosus]OWJ67312.1 hypothetical protein BWR60_09970 [Inquilinus limosus]